MRVFRTQGEILVVVCDEELLGKRFRRGELRLEVKESFYRGEEASVKKCLDALQNATIGNLVGSIVEEAAKAGMIDRENVIRLQNVLHAQLVRL